MVFGNLNWLAIVLATVAYFAIGFLWYTVFFGSTWIRLMGKTREEMGSPGPGYAITVVAELISAIVLAVIIGAMGIKTVADGALAGLLLGVGIVATAYGIESIFAGRSAPLYLINVGYHVVALIVMGAILGHLHP
jgi:hypothetical protein